MNTPWLDLYKKWIKAGQLTPHYGNGTCGGLCSAIPADLLKSEIWKIVSPEIGETNGTAYWAAGDEINDMLEECYGFTPLRQNLILLCAALNNEL